MNGELVQALWLGAYFLGMAFVNYWSFRSSREMSLLNWCKLQVVRRRWSLRCVIVRAMAVADAVDDAR